MGWAHGAKTGRQLARGGFRLEAGGLGWLEARGEALLDSHATGREPVLAASLPA